MSRNRMRTCIIAALGVIAMLGTAGSSMAYLSPSNVLVNTWDANQIKFMPPTYSGDYSANPITNYIIGPGSVPDYLTTPNWAYSPALRKFVDTLPTICGAPGGTNNLGQCIPVAVADTATYPGSDYYEIELVQYREQMHSDLPPVVGGNKLTATAGGTLLRGYRQVNGPNGASQVPYYLGPLIIADKDRPVRVKFINSLPVGSGGDLFVPVDKTVMGAGPFEINYDPITKQPGATISGEFSQNRGELHLHGGRTPWISDGTPHQWITPADEVSSYPRGVSVENVPDMPDPGPGAQTYYWTNQQSARMLFFHDHTWGITRLNVYVGEAAGFLIRDQVEKDLINGTNVSLVNPGNLRLIPADEIPLIIQDKTFVDAATIKETDPTWAWGSQPWNGVASSTTAGQNVMTPVTGDLWWPHIYMPAQNPFDITGIAPMGRWAYGPYFWPATNNPYQPVPNPYYHPDCNPDVPATPGSKDGFCQPPEIPSSPNPSWGAEAFMDTPTVNGTAYPVLTVEPKSYRFRILNAAHDRFFNLQMYEADLNPPAPVNTPTNPPVLATFTAPGYANFVGSLASNTEVKMVPAVPGGAGKPATWPEDGRPGGVPDWNAVGPKWIMIGSEGGFLPQPVVIPNQPVNWNADVTTFNAGNVNTGSLILGAAERADVIVDFTAYAGKTLILYNDAPAPWPALDPHYDYYTDAPDNRDMGGADTTPIGFGPNTRTIMQIKVGTGTTGTPLVNYEASVLNNLKAAFSAAPGKPSVFQASQDPLIVAQGNMNPTGDPAFYEAFPFEGQPYDGISKAYNNNTFATIYPNWGVARINDKSINFKGVDGSTTYAYNAASTATLPWDNTKKTYDGLPMKFKAIQDEQGETFDDFGRMRAALGLELVTPGAGRVNFIVQTYSDPATEVLEEEGIQVWKITHNGVDTHPVHFHLFDVQVLNRVGWDGFIRLPDPTEQGWKDTVRISPLEDTIVALKPVTPKVPFGIPESFRPKNPATPLGDNTELSMVDPTTGQAWDQPNLNSMINLKWEYVWHCHILSHEENDMMRPMQFNFISNVPDTPVLTGVQMDGGNVVMTWTDPTPAVPANLGLAKNEIGFGMERCPGTACTDFIRINNALANSNSYSDSTASGNTHFTYRVFAYNAAGQSPASSAQTVNINSVNGVCGASNGLFFPTAPTTNLCTVGAPSTVSGTGPWNWTCSGLNEGITANCSANIQSHTVTFVPGGNGTISGTTPQTINHGGSATTVTAIPGAGAMFNTWTDQSSQFVGASPSLTLANVISDMTITANFVPTYSITLDRCMSGPTVVGQGSTPGYTFDAAGFDVTATVNGAPITVMPTYSYTFITGITANQVFSAAYTINPVGTTAAARLVRPNSSFTEYTTLQAAYNAAVSGDTILLKAGSIAGTFNANKNITVTIKGGYEATFTRNCGTTLISGRMNLQRGKVILEQIRR